MLSTAGINGSMVRRPGCVLSRTRDIATIRAVSFVLSDQCTRQREVEELTVTECSRIYLTLVEELLLRKGN